VGPNYSSLCSACAARSFQSSVRINVGPNIVIALQDARLDRFQSSVRINVGPNRHENGGDDELALVSILRED